MKQLKQSLQIHVWEEYEFYLHIPHNFLGSNKPFIFYYFKDDNINKLVRIRKYLAKHNGDKKKIKADAKALVLDIVEQLKANWNPLTNCEDAPKINLFSSIKECVDYWLQTRTKAFENKSLCASSLKNNKITMMHFTDYLTKHKLLSTRVNAVTNIHIKDFLDSKAFERNWNKVSYNTYRIDMVTFFNYLLDLNIMKYNPVRKVPKKSTKFDSSRFKVFELEELKEISQLLAKDKSFLGLHLGSKILFKYNIRPVEITRIQVMDFNWDKNTLTLPPDKTKNGNEAVFKLDQDMGSALKSFISNAEIDHFVFSRRNKPSPLQYHKDYFGARWREFRKRYGISYHLKFYALKHSSNYYDIENGVSYEDIRQRNRHSNLQITTIYIRERLFKNIIKPSSSVDF
jgi:integrase